MEQLADKIVQMLEERKIIESVQREDYIYAVSCIAQAAVTNGVIFMLSMMYKTVWETFAFLLFFFGLRKASGGYHALSFGECFAESIGCYIGITILSRYFSFSQGGCLIVFVLSVLIILVIGSVNLIGNEKSEIEYRLSKIAARIDVATYKKTTYAKTEGYYKRHYVRAYIGGSNNSASGANADSGRKWSSGNVKATASMKKKIKGSDAVAVRFSFPIGYAKYGQ